MTPPSPAPPAETCRLCAGVLKVARRHKDGDSWAPATPVRIAKGWFNVRDCPECVGVAP